MILGPTRILCKDQTQKPGRALHRAAGPALAVVTHAGKTTGLGGTGPRFRTVSPSSCCVILDNYVIPLDLVFFICNIGLINYTRSS